MAVDASLIISLAPGAELCFYKDAVIQDRRIPQPRAQRQKLAIALLTLGLWITLQAFGASARLHSWLHADAASPGHQCAITIISHGQIDSAPSQALVTRPELSQLVAPVIVTLILVESDHRLQPERGPPSFLL